MMDSWIGGITIPNCLHASTSFEESNSLLERPAARIFACSSSEKFFHVNSGSIYFLYSSRI
jgi:hypothetical protein